VNRIDEGYTNERTKRGVVRERPGLGRVDKARQGKRGEDEASERMTRESK
jgi:hypothetical protein